MALFDRQLAEVETDEGIRYVLRRNPIRAMEVRQTRQEKLTAVQEKVDEQNQYLAEHGRAQVEVACRKVQKKIEQLKLTRWLNETASGRVITLSEDSVALAEEEKLDGCYVLKTDLTADVASKETVHSRSLGGVVNGTDYYTPQGSSKSRVGVPHQQDGEPGGEAGTCADCVSHTWSCIRGDAFLPDHR